MTSDGSGHDDRHTSLLARLSGGDRRSTGRADEVAAAAVIDPALVPVLVELLRHADPVVRMRAADALEKASRRSPHLLFPHSDVLPREIGGMEQQELRWHVAPMLPRLPLDATQLSEAVTVLKSYLGDPSRIVVVEALSALAAMTERAPSLCAWLVPELERAVVQGAPAVRTWARRLLVNLATSAPERS